MAKTALVYQTSGFTSWRNCEQGEKVWAREQAKTAIVMAIEEVPVIRGYLIA
jgi:hypothetical protein